MIFSKKLPAKDQNQLFSIIMPEGPEVKRTGDVLRNKLVGARFHGLHVTSKSRYAKSSAIPGGEYLHNCTVSNKKMQSSDTRFIHKSTSGVIYSARGTFTNVVTKGKKIFIGIQMDFGPFVYLVSFLGMEGHWQYTEGSHSGIIMRIGILKQVGNRSLDITNNCLYYDDARHFGSLRVVASELQIREVLKDTGPDLLAEEVTLEMYVAKIRSSRLASKQIAWFVMQQNHFSGVGNYLKAEILYASKVAPSRLLGTLSDSEIINLYSNTIGILKESYSSNGLTIATYRDPDGILGTYKPKVYRQKTDSSGNLVVTEAFSDKRTTHWVPNIQK